ncbi:MAG TPA: hypothetical protein PLP04_19720 [Bryobacteraceae bacterium]|mgnify:CR=1 FL=1|nr:hypothetical protein [Bryobacteraceae bacterium]HPQ17466.1 hypothetical protein [Bryobacteraceae bacterium]
MLQPVDPTAGFRDASKGQDVLILKCGHAVVLHWDREPPQSIPSELECQRCEPEGWSL